MASQWTIDTLKEYLERVLQEREHWLTTVFTAVEARLTGLNDLRKEVIEDRTDFLTKEAYESRHEALDVRVVALERFQNRLVGIGLVVALVAGVSGALIARVFGG